MKEYPSIPRTIVEGLPVIGFDKIDGSNIRAEWNAKSGWYKFGTRHRLVDETDEIFGKVPALVRELGASTELVFRKLKWERAMAFFEFWGSKSGFGQHAPNDQHWLVLLDVNCHKRGRLGPKTFLQLFHGCPTPAVVYQGKMTWELAEKIRDGSYPEDDPLMEGVVFKEDCDWNPRMFKVKTDQWIEEAKRRFSDNPQHLAQLL